MYIGGGEWQLRKEGIGKPIKANFSDNDHNKESSQIRKKAEPQIMMKV
jgi:hypothetical protein